MKSLCVCFSFLSGLVWAQTYTASVRGTVTDSSHAMVPSASIVATEVDRNVQHTTKTDGEGRYILTSLLPGRYTLVVEAIGFQKTEVPAFSLEVQQQATVNVQLAVGTIATTVEVEATAPLLNTTSATLGQVVENRIINSLPNSGRNPLRLLLAPGILSAGSGTDFISSGVRNNASEVMMDGGPLHRHRTERWHHRREVHAHYRRGGGVQGANQLLQRRVR